MDRTLWMRDRAQTQTQANVQFSVAFPQDARVSFFSSTKIVSKQPHAPKPTTPQNKIEMSNVLPPEVAQIMAKALATVNIATARIAPYQVLELILKLRDHHSTFSRIYERRMSCCSG